MIYGIGTDIILIKRIKDILNSSNNSYFERIYSGKERNQAVVNPDPLLFFSTRFSGKEAVLKCLNTNGDGISFNEIQILQSESGQPYVELTGNCSKLAEAKGIKNILISLSYDNEYIIAFAIAQN